MAEADVAVAPKEGEEVKSKEVFELRKWQAVAFWSWDVQQDTCAICRNSLYEPSIENQANGNPEVVIAWGVCNHCFHMECIQRWLKTRNVCPLCNREWDFQKFERVV